MRLPIPTRQEVRLSGYVVALAALALVATLCWATVQRIDQGTTATNQVTALTKVVAAQTEQIRDLSAKVDAQKAAADAAAQAATASAHASVKQRQFLQRQNRMMARELSALLDYLRAHGIAIPKTIVSSSGGSSPRPKGRPGARPPLLPLSPYPGSPTGTPGPTASPGIDLTKLCALLQLPGCPFS